MILTFLGTGTSQGVPVIGCNCSVCSSMDFRDQRTRTSIMIESDSTRIVVDTGPDFRTQMLRERVKSLDAVVFTHEHKDHTAGLDDVRSFNFLQKRDMPVYARPQVIDQLKKEFSYIFAENKYPGVPRLDIHELNGESFEIGDIALTPVEVWHYKLPVYGFRIGDLAYITDANRIEESEKAKLRDCKYLIINALQFEPHISHFTVQEALDMIEDLNPQKAYFTHISHKLGTQKEVGAELPDRVEIAYDGLQIKF